MPWSMIPNFRLRPRIVGVIAKTGDVKATLQILEEFPSNYDGCHREAFLEMTRKDPHKALQLFVQIDQSRQQRGSSIAGIASAWAIENWDETRDWIASLGSASERHLAMQSALKKSLELTPRRRSR